MDMTSQIYQMSESFGKKNRKGYAPFFLILILSALILTALLSYIFLLKPTSSKIDTTSTFALIVFIDILVTILVSSRRSGYGRAGFSLEGFFSNSPDRDYSQKLGKATRSYLDGKIDKDQFFREIGKKTKMEEDILEALNNMLLSKSTKK